MVTLQDLDDRLGLVKNEVEEVDELDEVEVTIDEEASLQETMEEEAGGAMEEGCSTAFRRRRLVVTPNSEASALLHKRLIIASL